MFLVFFWAGWRHPLNSAEIFSWTACYLHCCQSLTSEEWNDMCIQIEISGHGEWPSYEFFCIYIYIYRCIHIKLFYMYIQGIFSFIYSHVLHLLSRFRKGKISASSIGIFARLTAFAVLNSRCVAATGERQCNAFANKSQPHWKQNPESTFFRQRVLKAKIFKEKLSALKTSLVCLTINH